VTGSGAAYAVRLFAIEHSPDAPAPGAAC